MRKGLIKILALIFFFTFIISYAGYNYIDFQIKKNDYKTYKINGHIRELLLVTTFPDEGLYIGFDNGEYRFVDINYWWAYSNLKLIQSQNNVSITYERNYYGNLKVLHIQEVEV